MRQFKSPLEMSGPPCAAPFLMSAIQRFCLTIASPYTKADTYQLDLVFQSLADPTRRAEKLVALPLADALGFARDGGRALGALAEEHQQQRLLRMQAIFRLVEHH